MSKKVVSFNILIVLFYLFTLVSGVWEGEDVGTIQETGKKVVVSGQEKFPFMVEVDIDSKSGSNICGGVIISRRVVLTAAHCIHDKIMPIILIRAGIVDFFHEKHTAQKRIVIDHYIHEKFRRKCQVGKKRCCYLVNDIALLWTAKNFEFGPKVKQADFNLNEKPIGKTGWILGWGLKSNGIYPTMLQKGLVKVASEQMCEKFNPKIYVIQNVICLAAVSGGTRAGKGDSGGPFVIDDVIYGLSSYTFFDECRTKALDVYTYVGKYYTWIKSNVDAGPPKNRPKTTTGASNEPPTKRRKVQ